MRRRIDGLPAAPVAKVIDLVDATERACAAISARPGIGYAQIAQVIGGSEALARFAVARLIAQGRIEPVQQEQEQA